MKFILRYWDLLCGNVKVILYIESTFVEKWNLAADIEIHFVEGEIYFQILKPRFVEKWNLSYDFETPSLVVRCNSFSDIETPFVAKWNCFSDTETPSLLCGKAKYILSSLVVNRVFRELHITVFTIKYTGRGITD